jgi:hypothetical protein
MEMLSAADAAGRLAKDAGEGLQQFPMEGAVRNSAYEEWRRQRYGYPSFRIVHLPAKWHDQFGILNTGGPLPPLTGQEKLANPPAPTPPAPKKRRTKPKTFCWDDMTLRYGNDILLSYRGRRDAPRQ